MPAGLFHVEHSPCIVITGPWSLSPCFLLVRSLLSAGKQPKTKRKQEYLQVLVNPAIPVPVIE